MYNHIQDTNPCLCGIFNLAMLVTIISALSLFTGRNYVFLHALNSTEMECLVSFTPRHLYPHGKITQYQLNRSPGPAERFGLLSCTVYAT